MVDARRANLTSVGRGERHTASAGDGPYSGMTRQLYPHCSHSHDSHSLKGEHGFRN